MFKFTKNIRFGTDWGNREDPFGKSRPGLCMDFISPIVDAVFPSDDPQVQQESSSAPWQAEELKYGMDEARRIYDQGPVELMDSPYTADRSQLQLDAQGNVSNYLGGQEGIAQIGGQQAAGMMANPYGEAGGYSQNIPNLITAGGQGAIDSLYNSDGSYIDRYANQYRDQAFDYYNKNNVPGQTALITQGQQGGGSRGDIYYGNQYENTQAEIENQVSKLYYEGAQLDQSGKGMALGAELGYGQLGAGIQNQYAQQGNQNLLTGANVYGGLQNAYLGGQESLYGYGTQERQYGQEVIGEAGERFDYEQNKEGYALDDYFARIQGDYGGTEEGTTTYDAGVDPTAKLITGLTGGLFG